MRVAAVPSLITAALCAAFCSASMSLSLIGQLLLNLSMPLTLGLLYRHMPGRPGTAFGLAAAALWPGTLFGALLRPHGLAAAAAILVFFLFSLYAILYSLRRVEHA